MTAITSEQVRRLVIQYHNFHRGLDAAPGRSRDACLATWGEMLQAEQLAAGVDLVDPELLERVVASAKVSFDRHRAKDAEQEAA
jgi:hypothetical protein